MICNCDACNAGGQCAAHRETAGTPQSMAAAILDLRARLAEAAAGMERAVRERDEARAALAKEVARDDDITRLHRHLIAERDAAIARAEAAEQRADERAAHATWQATEWNADTAALRQCAIELGEDGSPTREVYKRARAERAAREKAEAACAEMREAIAALLQECDECDESPGRWMHTGSTVSAAAVEAQQTKAGSALLVELRARRKVCEAAAEMAAWDWTHLLVDHPDADDVRADAKRLDAALDAVPKGTRDE